MNGSSGYGAAYRARHGDAIRPPVQSDLGPPLASPIPLSGPLKARRAAAGRPAKDRIAPAMAFLAKAILNLPTTRASMSPLQVEKSKS